MKTTHDSRRVHTITDDQAFEIHLLQLETRGLLYLLGMAAAKSSHGLTNDPDEAEEEGILCLVAKVGSDMTRASDAAFNSDFGKAAFQSGNQAQESAANGTKPETAPESISRGGCLNPAPDCPDGDATKMQQRARAKTGSQSGEAHGIGADCVKRPQKREKSNSAA